ncbi:MAG: signal recognition particle-docking protein FtsY [Rhodoluna sp.]|nr:signal recognition particle-docking protein FtsY [Rhodoluna sp.]
MAGLFFWRKKREAEPEPTSGVDLPKTPSTIVEPEKPKEKKLKLFKPKVKVEAPIEPTPEPVDKSTPVIEEPEPEVIPEPEIVAVVAEPVVEPVVEELEVIPEPFVEPEPEVVDEPVALVIEPEVELEQVELPKRSFVKGIKSIFTRIKFDVENLDELEDTLIQSDFGVDASAQIVESVKQRAKKQGAKTDADLKAILVDVIAEALERDDKQLNLFDGKLPYVILVVGVNGVGKTTTIGKLANWLNEGKWRVVIGAADTFRAAAVEQIATWAERANAQLIRPDSEGQDPASVAFKTVELALKNDADVAIIDTAGRLQNKKDLMAELEKIRRVVEKQAQISETLLVIDATTGQNGLVQAKAFAEVANVTGIVLTKLDGTAKGGIVYSIQRELGIPVKLVGVGESIADFAFFDAREFAKGLVG